MARNPRGLVRRRLGVIEEDRTSAQSLTQRVEPASRPTRPPTSKPAATGHEVGCGAPEAEAIATDPLYPVALLKIAMAMKRLGPENDLHFDRILGEVLQDLSLDADSFRAYLDRNRGRLMAAVRTRGY